MPKHTRGRCNEKRSGAQVIHLSVATSGHADGCACLFDVYSVKTFASKVGSM